MHMDGLKWTKNSLRVLCDILFPRRCPVCDGLLEPELFEQGIHTECLSKLKPVHGSVCMQCGRPLENDTTEYCYDCQRLWLNAKSHKMVMQQKSGMQSGATTPIQQGKALFLYEGAIKETMYRFKYSNKREYADFFAREAVKQYGEWIRSKHIQVIVPVPMYRAKQRKRGYNQAEVFAKALGRCLNIPVDTSLVRRVKDTIPQKELNDLERKNNLKSAFQKIENIVQYSHILVVDDIYTTGSTAMAVAEQLRKTKASQIYFFSICIGKGM